MILPNLQRLFNVRPPFRLSRFFPSYSFVVIFPGAGAAVEKHKTENLKYLNVPRHTVVVDDVISWMSTANKAKCDTFTSENSFIVSSPFTRHHRIAVAFATRSTLHPRYRLLRKRAQPKPQHIHSGCSDICAGNCAHGTHTHTTLVPFNSLNTHTTSTSMPLIQRIESQW